MRYLFQIITSFVTITFHEIV